MKTRSSSPRLLPLAAVGLGSLSLVFTSQASILTGVTVTDSAPEHSAPYVAANAVDNNASDYASANQGANTFITFAFPSAQAVNRVVVLNRDSPAASDLISSFTLTFDGGVTTSITRASTIRGSSAIINLGGTFLTTTARLDVDTTADAVAGGNTGVMEVFFLSPMVGKAVVPAVSILGGATPFPGFNAAAAVDGIVGRVSEGPVQPEYASFGLGLDTYVDFDLGALRPVSGFDFYDRPAAADRVTGFNMIFSQNATFGDGDDVLQSFTNASMAMSAEFGSVNARYVRYDVTGIAGGVNTGLSEMVFYETVPEPTVSVSVLAGLAGMLLRRRRGSGD